MRKHGPLIVALGALLAICPVKSALADMDPVIARIRDQGLNHSHVEQTLDHLCNVIGGRLTGSPAQQRASEWTRDTLQQWGLADAHLETWGPFGNGWSLNSFSLRLVEPNVIVLNGYPKAWSPGIDGILTADVVYLDAHQPIDLKKYTGTLKGKIVLIGQPRPTPAHFEPQATRMSGDDLTKLANAPIGKTRAELLQSTTQATQPATTQASTPTTRQSTLAQTAAANFATEEFNFACNQGAAVVIDSSIKGDGGTVFVAGAQVPGPATRPTTATTQQKAGPATRPKPYAVDVPPFPPQFTLAVEDFNRLVRLIENGEPLKMAVDLSVHFYPPDQTHVSDTIAEIPGSDLKDQIVMVGGHLDSWHAAQGATDNAVGAACAMEAVRIIQSLGLHPRRTIRVGLWTGEEQGLLGSISYVKHHLADLPDQPDLFSATPPKFLLRNLVKKEEYDRLSVYFNLDNGTGKIRGLYAQSNPAAVPLFKQWLAPFADLDASTVTLANTGSTDHISFDRVGVPGFQFIQDPIEYMNRTHHSNEDTFDRIQIDDMKQASTIMAACLWDAASMDQRFPRKADK